MKTGNSYRDVTLQQISEQDIEKNFELLTGGKYSRSRRRIFRRLTICTVFYRWLCVTQLF